MVAASDTLSVISLGFLLIEDFAMLPYASLIEPFRAANTLSGTDYYAWQHYSVDGGPVRASNGLEIAVDGRLDRNAAPDILFVCAGGNPSAFRDSATFAQLRRIAAGGTTIAGISGGPYILARAGLLAGRHCTIHWEHETAFREAFPDLEVEGGLYVRDGNRITCAGGIAGLDLAVELIGEAHGPALAAQVGEWHIRTQPRHGGGSQRPSLAARYRVTHPGIVSSLAAMEANIAEPLNHEDLAAHAGLSVRQLERLFAAHLGRSIGQEYLRLRLEAALRLLRETDLSRIEVAMACGFADVSHFSRRFRAWFGTSPMQARRTPGLSPYQNAGAPRGA
ncbi:AraC family transcriptional regulator [Novosphingobium nitrogenifigens DSM 19370]|uniref:AraC family transcriptional regulator n=2 Tax=Novosphingobium nitrogenifigens TaxID=378548 RepID=F1Z7D2_9SPHN|nr:AraC family transcriptional regulator [Novosphingobium nitrogenifigens DSM 19370]